MLLTRMRLFVIMIRVGNADYGGRLKNLVNPKANARDYLTWCCWAHGKNARRNVDIKYEKLKMLGASQWIRHILD